MTLQPLSTAPTGKTLLLAKVEDGRVVLMSLGHSVQEHIGWGHGWKWSYARNNPTHWAPVPEIGD